MQYVTEKPQLGNHIHVPRCFNDFGRIESRLSRDIANGSVQDEYTAKFSSLMTTVPRASDLTALRNNSNLHSIRLRNVLDNLPYAAAKARLIGVENDVNFATFATGHESDEYEVTSLTVKIIS